MLTSLPTVAPATAEARAISTATKPLPGEGRARLGAVASSEQRRGHMVVFEFAGGRTSLLVAGPSRRDVRTVERRASMRDARWKRSDNECGVPEDSGLGRRSRPSARCSRRLARRTSATGKPDIEHSHRDARVTCSIDVQPRSGVFGGEHPDDVRDDENLRGRGNGFFCRLVCAYARCAHFRRSCHGGAWPRRAPRFARSARSVPFPVKPRIEAPPRCVMHASHVAELARPEQRRAGEICPPGRLLHRPDRRQVRIPAGGESAVHDWLRCPVAMR